MSSTTTKVLTGCGIGCLMMIVLAAGVSFMGYRWVRDTTESVEEAGMVERELEEIYGQTRAYVPAGEPGVPVERMEVFLAVREKLNEPRKELAQAVAGLSGLDGEPGVANGFRAARAGIGLGPRVVQFVSLRNSTLLDAGMGMGEYTWFYWLTYYAWLGHPAEDSVLNEAIESHESDGGSVQIHIDGGMEPERITWRLRRDITAMLRNLESELTADPEQRDFLDLVAVELAELEANAGRVPWEDGLPDQMAVGLEPYRDRLEATYSKASNSFELTNFK